MDKPGAQAFILEELAWGLPGSRPYHSVEHTLDVHGAALRIAKNEGVEGEDLDVLLTAALFHDSGFLVMPDAHEQGSCLLARQHLPRFGYPPSQVERVCNLILSTRIPQNAHDPLSRILCDADLDYLGREDFFLVGDRLFRELMVHGGVTDRRAWNLLQEAFLAGHHYLTQTSIALREPVKQRHLREVRQWLRDHP